MSGPLSTWTKLYKGYSLALMDGFKLWRGQGLETSITKEAFNWDRNTIQAGLGHPKAWATLATAYGPIKVQIPAGRVRITNPNKAGVH